MKKIALFFVLAVLLPIQALAVEQWKEGEHYVVLDMPATKKPEIREYFSYWCPGCFRFEDKAQQIKANLPDGVEFKRVHVNFMPFRGLTPEIQDDATRAMMIAQSLNRSDALHKAIFNYIHIQGGVITGLKDLRNVFAVNDVDTAQFDKLSKSFGINRMLKQNNTEINKYRRFVNGVPNIIVNGRYQATFTRDMSEKDQVDLVLWLSQLQ